MDLQVFTLLLVPSVSSLLGTTDAAQVAATGGVIVACKLFAWGIGGVVFGVIADRIGRARTMTITVVIYSLFTGSSALAQSWWQLAILQALAGLGMGGEWAAGAALVAETWPERSRARALQVMQMCFGLGFFAAALLNLLIGPYGWRWVLLAGAAPAPIILLIRLFVREPDRWIAVRRARAITGDRPANSLRTILAPGLRLRTIVGVLLASTMMLTSNGVSPLLPTWVHQMLPPDQQAQAAKTVSHCFMLYSAGGLAGYAGVIWLMELLSRRWSYAVIIAGAAATTLLMFTWVTTVDELQVLLPLYGVFAVGGFGFFAVYFPELFPTAVRATGQGFCWNVGRLSAALGPLVSGRLVGALGSVPAAGRAVALIYAIGLIAIWFAPETKGQPLQD
jgi:MFS family permease